MNLGARPLDEPNEQRHFLVEPGSKETRFSGRDLHPLEGELPSQRPCDRVETCLRGCGSAWLINDSRRYAGAVHEWSAEVTVDRDFAYRLIAGQFHSLEPVELRLLSEGWDNTVWLVDGRWVFRFPRREAVIAGIERETALLPRLAPLLPLPLPTPVFFGRPADGHPWPFFGAAQIPGMEIADSACSDADRCRLARPLAAFLRALHDGDTVAAVDPAGELPSDPMGRADMALRVPLTERRLSELDRLETWRAPESVHEVLDAARGLGAPQTSSLVHGDLHIRHLLLDDNCGAAGVLTGSTSAGAIPRLTCPCSGACCRPPRGTISWMPTGLSPTRSCCAHACLLCS
jgi:aminoglycoside phosphotransferase (APT) family kinase protein